VIISATQYKTFLACRRKWAFERVWRLPQVAKSAAAQILGTVTHAVLARWLEADETGRDKAGKSVNIYPDGWMTCKDGTVTDEEAEEIKALVQLGIDSGIVLRRPGREIEKKFDLPVVDDVGLTGYIDLMLLEDAEVHDHKVSKNSRYCLSEASIQDDPQMLIYAAYAFYQRHLKGLPERPVLIRHNQFVRQPSPRVQVAEAHVDLPRVDEFWMELTQMAKEMLDLRSTVLQSSEYASGEWAFVAGAEDTKACNAYGGCPFLSICGGKNSIKDYTKRIKQIIDKSGQQFDQKETEEMSLFDKMKKKKLPCQAEPEAPAVEDPKVAIPCIACGGKGQNSKGFPCKACMDSNKDMEVPPAPTPEPAPVVETASAPEPAPAPPNSPADAPEVAPEVPPEVPGPAEEKPKRRGRPKGSKNKTPIEITGQTGVEEEVKPLKEEPPAMLNEIAKPIQTTPFPPEAYLPPEARIVSAGTFPVEPPEGPTLYVRCMPVGRTVNCVERIFKAAMALILADLGDDAPDSFWSLDVFKRRDMLTLAAGHVEILTDVFVAAPDSTPEMKAFVQGLRSRFENIVEGI